MITLKGKVAVVTGCSSGIGAAVVRLFLSLGAEVRGIDLNPPPDDIRGRIKFLQTDISDEKALELLASYADFARVDVLINNAGIDQQTSATIEDWPMITKILKTNLIGTLHLSLLLAERTPECSSIINVTSVHTQRAFRNALGYDTTKNGLWGATKTLALQLAPRKIRVNSVAPGFIYPTGITERYLTPEQAREVAKKVPLQRPGTPQDVAQACAFLASDVAAYITGIELPVDGGFLLEGPFS